MMIWTNLEKQLAMKIIKLLDSKMKLFNYIFTATDCIRHKDKVFKDLR